MLYQQLARPLAYKLDPQGINQTRQRILLARFNLIQQVLCGFLGHALQSGNRVFLQRIEIRDILDEPFVHKLIHDFVAQPIDVHCVPPRKVQNRFFPLRRTRRIHAAVRHLALNVMNRAPAFRALPWHEKGNPASAFAYHLYNLRDNLTGSFDQHGVANLQFQALDLIHVVECGTADSDASHLHRL